MKIIGIGDLLIPCSYIEEGFSVLKDHFEVVTKEWKLENYQQLQSINLDVEQHGPEAYQADEEMLKQIEDADILITQFFTVTKAVIDRCRNLKAIGVLRGGVENVDVGYATSKGIAVFHTPGRNADAVADFTVGMMISECRNIAKSHRELRNGNWVRDYANKDYVPDLPGKTVGIIGYGNIGRKVAQRLKGFEMDIIAYDPFVRDPDVKTVSLKELMERSDFVCVNARLTEETRHMINSETLSYMKKTAYLINTARSALVDEKALYETLKEGKIAGAAIDVFDEEPPAKDYPLLTLDNVTVTPHLAGGSTDAFLKSPILLAREMKKAIVEGQKTLFLLNKEIRESNSLFKGE